jgi:hypothetical protein
MHDDPPRARHRFELLFFVMCLVSGTALAVGGAVTGSGGLVIPGGVVAIASLVFVCVTATGRDAPAWMRADLAAARSAAGTRGQRVKFAFVLAGSAAFVVAGAVLIAVGAARNRPDMLIIGAVGCLFFGECAWIALAVLRGSI